MSLDCTDETYDLATTGRLSFAAGTMAGAAIVSLLAGTGINTGGVALQSTALPAGCYVFPINSDRLYAIKTIAAACGAVFFIRFDNGYAEAVCDTWANLLSHSDFTSSISVSDSTHLVISFNLTPSPEASTADRATIVMAGIPAFMFNQLDLSGLYVDMGITYPITSWRISE